MSPTDQLLAEVGPLLAHPCLMREKDGIQTFRAQYAGQPAFLKRFERAEFRREIEMYRLLKRLDIPTVPVLGLGDTWLALTDLSVHPDWRLADESDASDPVIARALAAWYSLLHEKSVGCPALNHLYRESDALTAENLTLLMHRFAQGAPAFRYAREHLSDLHALIRAQETTLTYNDFFWTNMAVRRDKSAALMLDYNFMGAGWRMNDLRNVTWSLSAEAGAAFEAEYRRLYRQNHGADWNSAPQEALDAAIDPLTTLIFGMKRDSFPAWARPCLTAAENGDLLSILRRILEHH